MEQMGVQVNWFDGVVVLIVGLYVWQGWEKGLYLVVGEMVSWVVAWVVGVLMTTTLAQLLVVYFGLPAITAPLWALLIVMIGTEQIVYRGLSGLMMKLPRQYFSRFWQVVLGLGPAFLSGVMVVAFLVLVLMVVPFGYPIKEVIVSSWFGQLIMGGVEEGKHCLGEMS